MPARALGAARPRAFTRYLDGCMCTSCYRRCALTMGEPGVRARRSAEQIDADLAEVDVKRCRLADSSSIFQCLRCNATFTRIDKAEAHNCSFPPLPRGARAYGDGGEPRAGPEEQPLQEDQFSSPTRHQRPPPAAHGTPPSPWQVGQLGGDDVHRGRSCDFPQNRSPGSDCCSARRICAL